MSVARGSGHVPVTQQLADHRKCFRAGGGVAREAVAQIVQSHTMQTRLFANVSPKASQINALSRFRIEEHFRAALVTWKAFDHGPRGFAQPDGTRTGFAVGQEQAAALDLAPGQAGDFGSSTSSQDQELQCRAMNRSRFAVFVYRRAKVPKLLIGKEPLALAPLVHSDRGARV